MDGLRQYFTSRGLSIAEAARRMRYTSRYVSRVLRGKLPRTEGFRARAMLAFGDDVAVFFEQSVSGRDAQRGL